MIYGFVIILSSNQCAQIEGHQDADSTCLRGVLGLCLVSPEHRTRLKRKVAGGPNCLTDAHSQQHHVEMGGQDKAAMSTLIFVQYLMSPVMLTISLTASAALMQIDGFIPSGEGLDFHSIFSFRELR